MNFRYSIGLLYHLTKTDFLFIKFIFMENNKLALVVGSLIGIMHLLWSILVATGFAQGFLNWIYGLHFLNNPFTVAPFNFSTAIFLVVFTFVVGYVAGWFFGLIWGMFYKD